MKFNTKTFGVLVAFAAFSFTACTTKEVRVVEAPAATEASENTTPEATEPEVTAPAFTLPIVEETTPPVTEAPVTSPPAAETDYSNDLTLDDYEYGILVQVLTEAGYGFAPQDVSEELGLSFCALSASAASADEFYQSAYDAIVAAELDVDEMSFAIGALMAAMCDDELVWLNG